MDLQVTYEKPRLGDIKHICADISKAAKLLGYGPEVPLRDGAQELQLRTCCPENFLEKPRLKLEFTRFLGNTKLTDSKALVACLSLGFFIRLIPELLAFPLPIGFDTIDYAIVMKSGVIWPHWSAFFTSSWLLYALIAPLYSLFQADPFLLLKIIAPLLFGLNVGGVYWFARKMLGWDLRMGLLTGVFFALQLASLRISWDLLRNTLGLGFLLFAMSYLKEVKSKRGFALFSSLSLLSVLAHEYAAVLLFVAVFGLLIWSLARKKVEQESKRMVLGVLPAFAVFLVSVGLRFLPIRYSAETNVIGAGDDVSGKAIGLFFLVDYLRVQNSVDSYATYWNLAFSVTVLFAVLFLPYLFLVIKGYFRNGVLNSWTGFLLVGAFGCLVVPFSALQHWYRWMFMLVYPFTFYAVYGLNKVLNKIHVEEKGADFSNWLSSKKSAFALLLTFGLAVGYLATPALMVYANTSIASVSGTYLYFSTNPTVPYQDVNDVARAVNWLNGVMNSGSCAILQHAYLSWGQLYLDKSHAIVTFDKNPNQAANTAFDYGFHRLYFVWWNKPIGWYGVTVPQGFISVQDFGRISVYTYGGASVGGS